MLIGIYLPLLFIKMYFSERLLERYYEVYLMTLLYSNPSSFKLIILRCCSSFTKMLLCVFSPLSVEKIRTGSRNCLFQQLHHMLQVPTFHEEPGIPHIDPILPQFLVRRILQKSCNHYRY